MRKLNLVVVGKVTGTIPTTAPYARHGWTESAATIAAIKRGVKIQGRSVLATALRKAAGQ